MYERVYGRVYEGVCTLQGPTPFENDGAMQRLCDDDEEDDGGDDEEEDDDGEDDDQEDQENDDDDDDDDDEMMMMMMIWQWCGSRCRSRCGSNMNSVVYIEIPYSHNWLSALHYRQDKTIGRLDLSNLI